MSYFTLSQGHLVGWIVVLAGLIPAPRAFTFTSFKKGPRQQTCTCPRSYLWHPLHFDKHICRLKVEHSNKKLILITKLLQAVRLQSFFYTCGFWETPVLVFILWQGSTNRFTRVNSVTANFCLFIIKTLHIKTGIRQMLSFLEVLYTCY